MTLGGAVQFSVYLTSALYSSPAVTPAKAGVHLSELGRVRAFKMTGENRTLKQPAVYILASKYNGTLYTGVTSNLVQRVYQHKNDLTAGFTQAHHVHLLVYFEMHGDMEHAIIREKRIKAWKRDWKIRLIEENNPEWNDLYPRIVQ